MVNIKDGSVAIGKEKISFKFRLSKAYPITPPAVFLDEKF